MSDAQGQRARHVDAGQRPPCPRATCFWSRLADIPAGRLTKFGVLVVWLALLLGLGQLSGKLTRIEKNDAAAYLPRNAESTRVYDELSRSAFGRAGSSAVVVYVRESGLTAADRTAVERDRQLLDVVAEGQEVGPATPSRDGRALLLLVPVRASNDAKQTGQIVSEIRSVVRADQPPGLQIEVTGSAAQLTDLVGAFGAVDNRVLVVTVAVVAVVLLLTYRSPVLWLVPLLVVGLGYTVAAAAVYLLASRTGIVVTSESGGILPVLVFGAGTDYALLVIARYREELHRHRDRHVAMSVALRRAVPSILASAATVAVGLLCLLVAELNSNRGLGPVLALGIGGAFVAITTLLPALLVILGRWLFWPFIPRAGTTVPEERGLWVRIGSAISRHPRRIWVPAVLALGLLATGLTELRLGLSQSDMIRPAPESVVGQQVLAKHFSAGTSEPTIIVADASAAETVVRAVQGTRGVTSVSPPNEAGDRVILYAVLGDPPVTAAAEDTAQRLRDAVHAVPGANALVGGDTAVALDTREASIRDDKVVIPLVLLTVLAVLALLLRALVAPMLLIATVILSFFTALGGSALIFHRLIGLPGVDYSVPLLGFVFLVALGVDYNIFLMNRVREEVQRCGHRAGVVAGLVATGGVITSAGVVLAATFSVLTVLTLVPLIELGVLVVAGVLLDTFVVRPILVPALALDVGPASWWPSRLGQARDDRD
jgi:RND superfamily putative drug exporter